MFDYIYKKLYILGLFTARYLGRFFKRVSTILLKPVKALSALLFAGFAMLKSSLKEHTDEAKDIMEDVKASNFKIPGEEASDEKKSFGCFAKKVFSKHGIALTLLTELVAPVVSFIILLVTVNYFNSENFALKITYNNADVGCVSSESVYLEAQEKAQQRLQTAAVTGEGTAKLKSSQYAIVPVKLTDLKDSDAICNKLIERSGKNITNACGIYIDGEFLCAVKNETDAATVFDNMLSSFNNGSEKQEDANDNKEENTDNSENSNSSEDTSAEVNSNAENSENSTVGEAEENRDESSATISFAEEIEYIQGLYPNDENTILDAAQLSQKLANNKKDAVYYVAHKGDTFAGVAGQYNISVSELRELNPNLSAYLDDGDKVLISKSQDLVRIQLTRSETRTVELAYDTIEIETSSLYKGIKKTVSEGVNGQQEITELVTYIDGERVAVKEVSRVTTVEPIAKKVQVGTKKNPYGTATSYGGRFLWPAIGAYSVSSYYGNRSMGWHGGIDIVKPGGRSTGLTIIAADDGTVVSAGYHYSWGYNIVINHGNGLSTRYAHMIRGSFKVSPGQKVYAGQPIGSIGSSGNVTGPHLHFEVMVNGNRVNPMPYLGR